MKKTFKTLIFLIVLAAIAYWGLQAYQNYRPKEKKVVFKYENILRQTVIKSISATGTVEPEELVNVGAQVNGKIMEFGKDQDGKTVDFGSKVKTGMILAQIDDISYKAELQEIQASIEKANAAINSAEANIKQTDAQLKLSTNNWERAKTLYAQKSMTKSDYDAYEAEFFVAQANCASAKAQLSEAKASLSSAEASLVKAKRNLEYCMISSPIDGVIIDRRVSIGQTVVSNQTASSIFLVAKDFKKMQVWVSVNEADVGYIKPGMKVTFSCDAFPGTEFIGEVFRLRLNATLSSNVVTYIVEVNTDNETGLLLPYLTANVKFIRDEHKNVLTVSNAALRYMPSAEYLADPQNIPSVSKDEAILWKENEFGKLMPVVVKLGINNGIIAEVISDKINENDTIVVGADMVVANEIAIAGKKDEANANPFLPNMPKMQARGSAGQRQRAEERAAQSGMQVNPSQNRQRP